MGGRMGVDFGGGQLIKRTSVVVLFLGRLSACFPPIRQSGSGWRPPMERPGQTIRFDRCIGDDTDVDHETMLVSDYPSFVLVRTDGQV